MIDQNQLNHFKEIINHHLTTATNKLDISTEYQCPVYVVAMCRVLADEIGCSLEDVLAEDAQAVGHTDYVQKLALGCVRLKMSEP